MAYSFPPISTTPKYSQRHYLPKIAKISKSGFLKFFADWKKRLHKGADFDDYRIAIFTLGKGTPLGGET